MPVEDRTQETLIKIILDKVEKGSIVYTDCFASYNKLTELGYQHSTVKHSENFVDPESGACVNKIESTWWAVKRALPSSHTRPEHFALHLGEYIVEKKKYR